MKSKLWYILGIILLVVIIVGIIVYPKYPNIEQYMKYLVRYKQEIVIKSKLEDTSNLDASMFNISTFRDVEQKIDDYFCGYICTLKNNSDIEFVVGWGKFSDGKLPFKTEQFVDNYEYVVRGCLQDKYSETLIITDENSSIDDAVVKVKNIFEQWAEEFTNYGLAPYGITSNTFNMKFDIQYNDKLIEDVEIWDTDKIRDIIVKAISNAKQ